MYTSSDVKYCSNNNNKKNPEPLKCRGLEIPFESIALASMDYLAKNIPGYTVKDRIHLYHTMMESQ